MKPEEVYNYLEPSKYARIIEELQENLNDMKWDGQNLYITKHELKWKVKGEEIKKWMEMLFLINNAICNEYRKRYGIIKHTVVLND